MDRRSGAICGGGVSQPINSGKKSVSVIGVFADNVGEEGLSGIFQFLVIGVKTIFIYFIIDVKFSFPPFVLSFSFCFVFTEGAFLHD